MNDQIMKHGGPSAVDRLRSLMQSDVADHLAIAKTAVKDGTKGLVVRGISVLQRLNEMRFGDAFFIELEEMRSAGRIREDFDQTDAGVSSLREFFELIDGKPDGERFRAFCALFMSANAPDADTNEGIFDIELMGILRRLSAGEMHLLSAFLKVRSYTVGSGNFMELLASELGYKSEALVHRNVAALIEEKLIEQSTWKNLGGAVGEQKHLLTDLGEALANRIDKYNSFKQNAGDTPNQNST
jgi:hypothetical protein